MYRRGFDPYFSFGNREEMVNLSRAARILLVSERDALESDCRGRYLGRLLLPGTDCWQGYLCTLTYGSGHVLPSVHAIEVEHMLLITPRRSRILSVSSSVGNPRSTTNKTADRECLIVSSP